MVPSVRHAFTTTAGTDGRGEEGNAVLEVLGLSSIETRVYTVLVHGGARRSGDVAAALGLPAMEVAAALQRLIVRSLVVAEKDGRFEALPPDVAGEVLVRHRMQELAVAQVELARLAGEYHGGGHQQRGKVPVEYAPESEVARRADRIRRDARREVLYFDTPPYWSVDNDVQLQQQSDGVSYRTVYDRQAIAYPGAIDRIDQCVEAGEQARVTARLPMKVMIVDREVAVLPALWGDTAVPGASAIIKPSPLLDGLIELFERVWADSVPFDRASVSAEARAELDVEDTRLLTLLLSGLTDEAVARHLGVGRRTVLRRARGLMDRAGVATRMQLGWYAAQRGWVQVARADA
ncbi:TrmB family transcriptional regulator [Streptomyces laurentii]|uniref:TrmB family transcriptional regulator n=1 Tax=Streptomyces laurentii TaxID=39478 RepID=UPI003690BB2A